jgi:hypothetical protein
MCKQNTSIILRKAKVIELMTRVLIDGVPKYNLFVVAALKEHLLY